MKKSILYLIIITVITITFITCVKDKFILEKEEKIEHIKESITINKSSIKLKIGDTIKLNATIYPKTNSIHWISSNYNIANVSNGIVTALKEGNVIITAYSEEISATCLINITAPEIINKIQYKNFNYYLVDDRQLYLENGQTNCSISFKSSDTENGEWRVGEILAHNYEWGELNKNITKISFDNYGGDIVGNIENDALLMNYIPEKTEINENLNWLTDSSWQNDKKENGKHWTKMPYIIISDIYHAGIEEGYIVGKALFSNTEKEIEKDFYRIWIKINIKENRLTVIETAICGDNNAPFLVGQKK